MNYCVLNIYIAAAVSLPIRDRESAFLDIAKMTGAPIQKIRDMVWQERSERRRQAKNIRQRTQAAKRRATFHIIQEDICQGAP